MFESEKEMSLKFEKFLKRNHGCTYIKEQQGLFGIPDFVFFERKKDDFIFIAFELKLKKWKRAARQAFRYKSFSEVSYVVLDRNFAAAALKNIDFFKQYNIGLATFDHTGILEIHFKPKANKPYSENTRQKLVNNVANNRKKTKTIIPFLG